MAKDTKKSLLELVLEGGFEEDKLKAESRIRAGEFEVDDYIDGYHVNKDAGYEFSQRLVKLLEVRPIPSN